MARRLERRQRPAELLSGSVMVATLTLAACSSLTESTAIPVTSANDAGDSSSTLVVSTSTTSDAGQANAARPDPAQASGGESNGWLGRGLMSEGEIELLWAGFDDATSYELHRLERDEVPEPRSPELNESTVVYSGSETAFADTTVVAGTRYYYFLVPNGSTASTPLRWALADAVTDTEPPTPVTGLRAERSGDAIELQWEQTSDNYEFARYAIRRSVDGGDSEYYGTGRTVDQTTFVDDLLPSSGSVTYEVRSLDFHGNASEPAIVTVDL